MMYFEFSEQVLAVRLHLNHMKYWQTFLFCLVIVLSVGSR